MPGVLSDRLLTATNPRFEQDWSRQRQTAADILLRLRNQEGVILADQVGMGKTYVALAVAVSEILSSPELGQVVIFVPAAVADKWVREWQKFSESLLEPNTGIRCVDKPLRSAEDFLKTLDDPPGRKTHLIVVTHTALTATLKDTFTQLALLHYATRHQRDGQNLRKRIAKWCTGRNGLIRHSQFTTDRVSVLLDTPPKQWRETWRRLTGEDLGDDPVPGALNSASRKVNFDNLREVIGSLPIHKSADIAKRLVSARNALAKVTQSTWTQLLSLTDLKLPLLIVDEAHRLKNNHTQLSKLFAPRSEDPRAGAFDGIFDRMLFLTATPFELGHAELINVLSRMGAVGPMNPMPARSLAERLDQLGNVLTDAQTRALTFDSAWGRLATNESDALTGWSAQAVPPAGLSTAAREAWQHARYAVEARVEMHSALRPWVIRHERPHRRDYHFGRAILLDDADRIGGIEIAESAALPFLLAARAQTVALDERGAGRPLFAYGIASSYEAFQRLEHKDPEAVLDSDTAAEDRDDPPLPVTSGAASDSVDWYRREIDRALKRIEVRDAHPKVEATAARAAEIWRRGEKGLIFCWFIRTGLAVEGAVTRRVESLINSTASALLDTPDEDSTSAELGRISERLFRSDGTSYRQTQLRITAALSEAANGHADVLELVVEAAIRNLRTPGYLVRYTPLAPAMTDLDVWSGIEGGNPCGVNLLTRWKEFAERMAAARDQTHDLESDREERPNEFTRTRDALLGAHADDDAAGRGASVRPVRRASGQTDRDSRERLIALFNTPFVPDLLVASSVMGEGIDLHQECRNVIHHDLDWNPSVLEQRTGRLDRIGSLAERVDHPIEVYEPYLAGTHDEKMFRVVKNRAQWFDIVMGRPSGADEQLTDAEEHRHPLPESIRAALTMDLRSPSPAWQDSV